MSRSNENEILGCLSVPLFLGMGGAGISAVLGISFWLGLIAFIGLLSLIPLGSYLNARWKVWDAERKKKVHEAWLGTPAGREFQVAEREKQRKQQKEAELRQRETERTRKEEEEAAARAKWRLYHESKTTAEIAMMSGRQFEEFLARLFSRMGYTDISLTPANDQGGDLLCSNPNREDVVVQAKRWKGTVGNKSVQELLAAMLFYDRSVGMVVTNSSFSDAARELARKDRRITLHDGRWLAGQIKKYLPPEIPEFNWEEYRKVVENFRHVKGARICPACHSPMRRVKSKYGRGRYFFGCTRYPACKWKGREPSTVQSEFERQLREQERLKHQAEEAVNRRQEADAARLAAEQQQEQLAKRKPEEERQRQDAERLRREQERLSRQAKEAVRRGQQEAAAHVERDRKQEDQRKVQAEPARAATEKKSGHKLSDPERLREQFARLKREKAAEQARAAAEVARALHEQQKRLEEQELERREGEQNRQRQDADRLRQALERLKHMKGAVERKHTEEVKREPIDHDGKQQESLTRTGCVQVTYPSSQTGQQATGSKSTELVLDHRRWIDRVVAFRAFDKRAKTLSMAECVQTFFLDQHEPAPAPTAAQLIARCARVVEKTVNLRSSNPLGAPLSASECLRQVWKEHTDEDPDPKLVSLLVRSVWLAEDEKRMGGRYGDKPSAGCHGIGIHKDEIGPWQENAIRALEGD